MRSPTRGKNARRVATRGRMGDITQRNSTALHGHRSSRVLARIAGLASNNASAFPSGQSPEGAQAGHDRNPRHLDACQSSSEASEKRSRGLPPCDVRAGPVISPIEEHLEVTPRLDDGERDERRPSQWHEDDQRSRRVAAPINSCSIFEITRMVLNV